MIAKELKEEVYKCIKCGICLTPCPVYNLLRFEGASPRGRVQLIKKILEGKIELSENFQSLLFTCLLCETCTANCPSGLQTDRLMKAMRSEILERLGPEWQKRMLGNLLRDKRRLPFFLFCERTRENLFSSQEDKSGLPRGFRASPPGFQGSAPAGPRGQPGTGTEGKGSLFHRLRHELLLPQRGKIGDQSPESAGHGSHPPPGADVLRPSAHAGRGAKDGLEEYPGKPETLQPEGCGCGSGGLRRLRGRPEERVCPSSWRKWERMRNRRRNWPGR